MPYRGCCQLFQCDPGSPHVIRRILRMAQNNQVDASPITVNPKDPFFFKFYNPDKIIKEIPVMFSILKLVSIV